jgi:hypothetical protein
MHHLGAGSGGGKHDGGKGWRERVARNDAENKLGQKSGSSSSIYKNRVPLTRFIIFLFPPHGNTISRAPLPEFFFGLDYPDFCILGFYYPDF